MFSSLEDENTVSFADMDCYEKALHVKEHIERCRSRSRTTGPQFSVAEELEKLTALKKKGVLTAEEFKSMKRRLLGQ